MTAEAFLLFFPSGDQIFELSPKPIETLFLVPLQHLGPLDDRVRWSL